VTRPELVGRVLARLLPALLVGACAGAQPCPGTTLAQIEADYAADVLAQCRGYHSLDACPAVPELQARRARDEQIAGCR
jgi:hypothetical protein